MRIRALKFDDLYLNQNVIVDKALSPNTNNVGNVPGIAIIVKGYWVMVMKLEYSQEVC